MPDCCVCAALSPLSRFVKSCLCRLRAGEGENGGQTKQPTETTTAWPGAHSAPPVTIEIMEESSEGVGSRCCRLCCGDNTRLSSEVIWENCWSLHTAQIRDRPIYRLLDLKGGGRLMDAYEAGGLAEARRMIQTEVPGFLYNGGGGLEVSGADIIAEQLSTCQLISDTRGLTNAAVTTADEVPNGVSAVESNFQSSVRRHSTAPPAVPATSSSPPPSSRLFDPARRVYNESTRHATCWDLRQRGVFGETLLHLCLLGNTAVHKQLAKVLLSVFPNLAEDIFVGWEYFGKSPLHMAIMNKDLEMVKLLVRCGADITQRAVGDFFQPEDQRGLRKAARTNYKGHFYLGEFPLAFAGCSGSTEIYDFLIGCGANPDSVDLLGNSVLHMLVIHNRTEIYRLALRHHKRPANSKLTNRAGLNPISLAAKLGRKDVFNEILDLSASEMWRFGNITCKVYPLTGLDTIGQSGRTDWNSAFMYIINGTTDEHLDMLEEGVINQLLCEKWQKYARARFLQRLCMLIGHIIIMSVAIYMRPRNVDTPDATTGASANSTDAANATLALTTVSSLANASGTVAAAASLIPTHDAVRYVFEGITVMNSLVTLFMHIDEVREQGVLDFLRGLGAAPPKASFLIACLLISLALPVRILNLFWASNRETLMIVEESLLIIAAPCVWIYLLFFAGGTKLIGLFVTMIYKMLAGDMARFGIIYLIILVCFAQAYFFLFRDIDQQISSVITFNTPVNTVIGLFQMTLGDFKYDEFIYTNYSELSKLVFAIFLILVPIMLLNMLIAMMGNTYNMVNSRSQKEWTSMWAKIVVILERSYSPKQLLRYQNEYTIPVPGKDGEVGLMTIHRTKKTLAFLRKTASNNWKRSCRKILQLIHDHQTTSQGRPFSFDGSEDSLVTIRRQRARLIGLQKSVVRTQRYAQVLKKMESNALGTSISAMQHDVDHSIQEIMESVPLEHGQATGLPVQLPLLTNSAFQILAAQESPKTRSLRTIGNANTVTRRLTLSKRHSSLEDDNSLQESVSSSASADTRNQTERSDSASSSKNLITTKMSPPEPVRVKTVTKAALSIKKTLARAKSPAKK